MDFELSEEQQLLKQTCERYFADHYQFESRQRYAHEPRGWSLICWKQYADLGLLGLPFAEDDGGTGAGPGETMVGVEQIGGALLLARTARRAAAGGRRGRAQSCLPGCRTAGGLQPGRHCDPRPPRRRWLHN